MAVVGVAPCQCFSPGGIEITSPGWISSIGPPSCCTHPKPAVTIKVCPSGWVCQAVRAPGSKVTLAPEGTSRGVWLEQWINAHCAGKPVGRSLAGWLRANSFDFHTDLFCVGYMGFDLGAENRRGGERRAGNPKKAASGNGHSLRIAESRLLAPRSNRLAVRSLGLKFRNRAKSPPLRFC